MSVHQTATEATMLGIANKSIAAGAGAAVIGGLTANEIAALGGLAVAVLGLLVQLVFKLRADRRAAELHRARLADHRIARDACEVDDGDE